MAELLPDLKFRKFDSNGDPLSGGKLYSYIAGTATPVSTYSDAAGSSPNSNPVVLDANGEADVYIATGIAYKFILTDSEDVVQWTVDDVDPSGAVTSSSGFRAWVEHAITDGMAATNLTNETLDLSLYSSAIYEVEVIRGTTVIANFPMYIQSLNGTGRVLTGLSVANEAHGVTFSLSQASTTVQLKAATDTGAGAGTIKLSRRLVAA